MDNLATGFEDRLRAVPDRIEFVGRGLSTCYLAALSAARLLRDDAMSHSERLLELAAGRFAAEVWGRELQPLVLAPDRLGKRLFLDTGPDEELKFAPGHEGHRECAP